LSIKGTGYPDLSLTLDLLLCEYPNPHNPNHHHHLNRTADAEVEDVDRPHKSTYVLKVVRDWGEIAISGIV
jgi:hypothetical protein